MIPDSDRIELNRLKERIEQMRQDTSQLWDRICELESRYKRAQVAEQSRQVKENVSTVQRSAPPPLPAARGNERPVTASANKLTPEAKPLTQPKRAEPANAPATVEPAIESSHPVAAQLQSQTQDSGTGVAVGGEQAPALRQVETAGRRSGGSGVPDGSLEMKLGTYWLVRVGIVMLLTALVFFGKYAYTNAIVKLGPLGKVILMYLGSGALLGVGAWLLRSRESLRNYAQVLFAGGCAGVYFTTYAAHHFEPLRVITSPILDGLLLMAWAGFVVFLADRRKSELLAVFALGLAFYASTITQIGLFTLFSNLVLTAATVAFLLRNRWAVLPGIGLIATYIGYAFWRFHSDGVWRWAGPEEGLWTGAVFLMCYWAIFTAAVFLSRGITVDTRARVGFLTTNNVAFLLLFLLTMAQVDSGGLWLFLLIYGGVLLATALLAQRLFETERWIGISYVLQGLTLVTAGLIVKFSGPQLGVILAAESVILLTTSTTLSSYTLRAFSCATALLATGFTIIGLLAGSDADWALGIGAGGLLAFQAWWTGRRSEEELVPLRLRPIAVFFSAMALLVWLMTVFDQVPLQARLPVLALVGFAITASIMILRVPELCLLAQAYVMLAQFGWCMRMGNAGSNSPAWTGLTILVVSVILTHWWSRQTLLRLGNSFTRVLEGLYAFGAVIVLLVWAHPRFGDTAWLGVSGMMVVGTTGYALLTRSALLACAAQLIAVVTVGQFLRSLGWSEPPQAMSLVPMLCLASLALGARHWLRRQPEEKSHTHRGVNTLAGLYAWTVFAMAVLWIHEHIPAREHVWVFAVAGGLAWTWAGWRGHDQVFAASALLSVIGLVWYFMPQENASVLYAPNLLLPILIAVQQQVARRIPDRFSRVADLHSPMMVVPAVALVYFLTSWVQQGDSGFLLTATWAGLAFFVFVLGFVLHERVYRWTGLGVLALALGRVVLVDVWKLDVLGRTISFLVLGLVLVALGFVYNRFQERLREWL
jgi:hypothetical protein